MKKILLGAMVMMLATAALFAAGQITRERAMEIALADAGVSADGASFVRSHLDRERGREVYDIEFYIDNMEYDYEIDAATGEILSVDRDAEYWGETSDATISEEEAVRIALEDARVDHAVPVTPQTKVTADIFRYIQIVGNVLFRRDGLTAGDVADQGLFHHARRRIVARRDMSN